MRAMCSLSHGHVLASTPADGNLVNKRQTPCTGIGNATEANQELFRSGRIFKGFPRHKVFFFCKDRKGIGLGVFRTFHGSEVWVWIWSSKRKRPDRLPSVAVSGKLGICFHVRYHVRYYWPRANDNAFRSRAPATCQRCADEVGWLQARSRLAS